MVFPWFVPRPGVLPTREAPGLPGALGRAAAAGDPQARRRSGAMGKSHGVSPMVSLSHKKWGIFHGKSMENLDEFF